MPLSVELGRRSASRTSLDMARHQQSDRVQPLTNEWVFLVGLVMRMTWCMTCRKKKTDECRSALGFLRKTAEWTRGGDLPSHPRSRGRRRDKPREKERL